MKRKIFLCAFILVLAFAGASFAEILAGPGIAVADTQAGKLQGYIHNGIFTYHGVPYAEADLFMPPTKIKAWDGIKMAVTYGYTSPQGISQAEDMFAAHWYFPLWNTRNYPQSNNCQNLNIWTPGLDDKKRPVMIWIHG